MDSYTMNRIMDEILGSIRQRRSAGTHRGVYWIPQSQLDEERKHKYALELEGQKSAGELDRQRLINTGNLDVQGARNIGELARQRLMNEGALAQENVRGQFGIQGEEIRAGAQKYGSDQTLKGHELTSAATIRASENRLMGDFERAQAERDKAKGNRPTPSELYIQSAGQFFDTAVYDSLRKREIGPPPIPEDDITAGTPPPTTPPPAPSPARTTLGGGKSMVFGDEGSATPMAVERPPRVRSIEEFTPWAKKKKKPFEF